MDSLDIVLADTLAAAHGLVAQGSDAGYATMKKLHDDACAELAALRARIAELEKIEAAARKVALSKLLTGENLDELRRLLERKL